MRKLWDNIEEYVCFTVAVVLLSLTFANIVSRYVIHASISFTEEITTNLFVLLSVMGTALAVKRGSHLGLSILTDALPKKAAELTAMFSCVVGAAVGCVLFYCGCTMVRNQLLYGAVSITLTIPAAIYGSFLPIGMFFVTVRFLQRATQCWRNARTLGAGSLSEQSNTPVA